MFRSNRAAWTAASLLAVAGLSAGAGAGVYAALDNGSTTVVRDVTTTVAATPVSTTASSFSINEIYNTAYRGVVDITVDSSQSAAPFGGQTQRAEGSGFVFDKQGNIITNQHVVDGANSITVKFWNGKTFKAHLVKSDDSTDLAVIKISAPSSLLFPLSLGNSSGLKVGDGVVAIGSPFGLPGTVTSGIVSALHRSMSAPNGFTISDSIQTDAPINHGNSGGPLLNGAGQVIGVNAQIESDSGGSDGVGFAIPSNTVRSVAAQLVAGRAAAHAYLGISVQDATATANGATGALAADVRSGTPAARAGLKAGDVIVRMAERQITSSEDLSSVIDSKKPGDEISVTFRRGGSTHTVKVTLGTRPS
jgi:putative serine protease PepD